MRSIISSIWREECLWRAAPTGQVCRLEPALCGAVRAPVPPHHQTGLHRLVDLVRNLCLHAGAERPQSAERRSRSWTMRSWCS